MPPETKLFLIIMPPKSPFGPIESSCTIVGQPDAMCGIGTEFSSSPELAARLATAGLPDFEIERAILRLEMNQPTFSEISHAAAESLQLIQPSGEVWNGMERKMFDTARLLPFGSAVNAGPAILPV